MSTLKNIFLSIFVLAAFLLNITGCGGGSGGGGGTAGGTTSSPTVDSILVALASPVSYSSVQNAVSDAFELSSFQADTSTISTIAEASIGVDPLSLGQIYDSLIQNGFTVEVNSSSLTKSLFIQVLQAFVDENYTSTDTTLKNIVQLIFNAGSVSTSPPVLTENTELNSLQSFLLLNVIYESFTDLVNSSASSAPSMTSAQNFQQSVNSGLALLFGSAVLLGGIGAVALTGGAAAIALPTIITMTGGFMAYSLAIDDLNKVQEAKCYISEANEDITVEDKIDE